MLDESWQIGCDASAGYITQTAVGDFRDYLEKSMGLPLKIVNRKMPKTLWVQLDASLPELSFVIDVAKDGITVTASEDKVAFRATIHIEDIMGLEIAPVLPAGRIERKFLYQRRIVHSGTGIDIYPDAELIGMLHAGYDCVDIFLEGFDRNHIGYCDINDIVSRAARLGIDTCFHNYIRTFVHPDEAGAQKKFDKVYSEIFRRYPQAKVIHLCGESLEFPSRDPHTTGKPFDESVIDGIPETKPSPGWYPCSDYPAYIQCIERAVHKAKPDAVITFGTYNWGYAPLELRKKFLDNFPENVVLEVTYEIFSRRKLGDLHTPVMDYTLSAENPGYYFTSECEEAAKRGIPLSGNVNTAGIAWDFGCVPLVPVPGKILRRDLNLRNSAEKWGLRHHYCTHHFGWFAGVAADLGKWTGWENYEPDYENLLRKIAIRDYGMNAAEYVCKAWDLWSEAMNYYTASNEDQYGPWRVGAAYPFIFHPNISRTMLSKEIKFPTAKHAHFGDVIIKTFYGPYENAGQSPGFLRYPQEIKSLTRMQELWSEGLANAAQAVEYADENKKDEAARLEALGHFIGNAIKTTVNIKRWYLANIAMLASATAEEAGKHLDEIEKIAYEEIENVKDTIPAVETDSRLGWEPSMEYVCDKWHLEWKLRQIDSAITEIKTYRRMLELHKN